MGYESGEVDRTRKSREGEHDSDAASSQLEACFQEKDDCYTLHRPLESVSTLLMDKAKSDERARLAYVRLHASYTRLFTGFRIGTSLFHTLKLMEASVLMRGD